MARLDEAWAVLEPAVVAHVRRFPPARTLRERLAGVHAAALGDTGRGTARLHEAVVLAERSGMRVELARACDALAQVEDGARWQARSHALWREMGARGA